MDRRQNVRLLLGMYLLGAVLVLTHLDIIQTRLSEKEILSFTAGLLLTDGLLNGSICAVFAFPTISLLFGCVSTWAGSRILTMARAGEPAVKVYLFWFIGVLISHFVLSGCGLTRMVQLRRALRKSGQLKKHTFIPVYACMLAGITAAVLLLRYIM